MNDWSYKKIAVCEADDFCDRWDRNGLNFLFYWKAKYPKFKISLFTIPNRTSKEMLKLIDQHNWIELCVHGWDHESNFECYGWDYDKTKALMERVYKMGEPVYGMYQKIFKAPGWTITPDLNGYPANPEDPIVKDKQAVYKALLDMGYKIVDRHYNKPIRPVSENIICIDCQPNIVHMHTWPMQGTDKAGRNGFQQVEEEHGVPWNNNTEFKFLSEMEITPCK